MTANNQYLYKVACNYYVALNIDMLKEKSYGILDIVPKDKDGNPLTNLTDAIVYDSEGNPLKQWKGFLDYLATFPDTDGDGIPNIPERYMTPQGRITDLCFVATAAYGSPFEPEVQVLRDFRDEVMSKSSWGRKLIDVYYTYGGNLAAAIEPHEGLKTLIRWLLLPVVGAAQLVLWLI